MRLNAQTDFSLRIMMFLAVRRDVPTTIPELAGRLGLSRAHTMRIVAKLVGKGLLASTRGRHGGLALADDPASVTVAQVIRAMEPDFAIVPCLHTKEARDCSIEPACRLKGVLESAVVAFLGELGRHTLADLVEANRTPLEQVFHLDRPYATRGCAVRPTSLIEALTGGVG
ncbi:MAG: Rrf2 family transcriptional regulator [Nitrospirae bacterium]|nr:Rrf2 family transcriptional regulator [Fimbriimonadaceae bacterium]